MAVAAVGLLLAVAAGGCEQRMNDEMTRAVVGGAKQVSLAGTEDFFSGSLEVRVTVSRGIGHGLSGAGHGTGGTEHDEEQRRTYHEYTDSVPTANLGNPMPPVTLHLILTNRGAAPLTVRLDDFESELGNFAVDPEVLDLAPGQTGEPTPMVSELGVSSNAIAFKVTLSAGRAHETHTITAVDVLDAPPKTPPTSG